MSDQKNGGIAPLEIDFGSITLDDVEPQADANVAPNAKIDNKKLESDIPPNPIHMASQQVPESGSVDFGLGEIVSKKEQDPVKTDHANVGFATIVMQDVPDNTALPQNFSDNDSTATKDLTLPERNVEPPKTAPQSQTSEPPNAPDFSAMVNEVQPSTPPPADVPIKLVTGETSVTFGKDAPPKAENAVPAEKTSLAPATTPPSLPASVSHASGAANIPDEDGTKVPSSFAPSVRTSDKLDTDFDHVSTEEEPVAKSNNKTKIAAALVLTALGSGALLMMRDPEEPNFSVTTPKTLAAKPLPSAKPTKESVAKPTPPPLDDPSPRNLSSSKNKSYFMELERPILSGDPYGAIQRFRAPLGGALDASDKIVAAEMESRYYLLTGSPKKAADLLQPICRNDSGTRAAACIHFLRALISSQKWREAQAFLDDVSDKTGYTIYKGQLDLSRLALTALSNPRSSSVQGLFENLITDMNFSPEWHRQRTQWLAIAFLSMSRSERYNLLKKMMETKREALISVLKHADTSGMTSLDPVLIPFLTSQVTAFELRRIGVVGKRSRWESDISRAAVLLSLVEQSVIETPETVYSIAQAFIDKPGFGELAKIVSANIALNGGNVQEAWNVLNHELGNIRAKKARFGYDWALIAARCAATTENPDAARIATRDLHYYILQNPSLKSDFQLWMLIAKLERLQRKSELNAFEQAKSLAVTAQDNGLVAIEQARRLFDAKHTAEGVKVIQNAIRAIPNHGMLLQAAAEILPRAGIDPKKYLEAHARVAPQYANRNLEYPIMSDTAMKRMLQEM